MSSEILAAALNYATRGLPVIPIRPGQKIPACEHGVKDATCIRERIEQWYTKTPTAGVGIAGGGPARLVIIDVDGDEGRVSLAALEQSIGTLPVTATAITPRGGEHRYFRFPSSLDINRVKNSVGKIGKKIDVRACGGYVVAPPTAGYVWTGDLNIAELPQPWATRLLDSDRSNRYGNAALTKAVDNVRNAPEGNRNDTLNREAFSLAQLVAGGELSEHVVREMLVSAGTMAGLSEHESRATVDSGLCAGREHPRSAPPPRGATRPAGGATEPPQEWTELIRYDSKGAMSKDPSNALVSLTQSPYWRGVFAYDTFADQITIVEQPPDVGGPVPPQVGDVVTDHHFAWIQYAMTRIHGVSFALDAIVSGVSAAAREHSRHCVRDWISSLSWDGTARLDTWLSRYLGAPDTDYTHKVGRWWLLSCAARIAYPGCQVDHMLVLEGRQGSGKSSAVRILGGDYYLGTLPDLRDKKAAAETLRGRWIVEIGELDAIKGSAATRVKDFLSQTADYYRPAYGRLPVTRLRECAFVATTNEQTYLGDSTGGRRFWPVRVNGLLREQFTEIRDQLWAEAWHRLRAGDQWWPDATSEESLSVEQEQRFALDDWEGVIGEWSRTKDEFTVGDVLKDCLGLKVDEWDRQNQIRAGVILHALGFEWKQVRKAGSRVRLYTRAVTIGGYRDTSEGLS